MNISAETIAQTAGDYEARIEALKSMLALAVKSVEMLSTGNAAVHRWLLSVKGLDPEVEGLDAVILLTAALLPAALASPDLTRQTKQEKP